MYFVGLMRLRELIYFPIENPKIMIWLSKTLNIEYSRSNIFTLSLIGVLMEFGILAILIVTAVYCVKYKRSLPNQSVKSSP